jgi:succinyl-diaminopimelate desuccinylase
MNGILEAARELLHRPSVTPDDQGCQEWIAEQLQPLGFEIEHMPFEDVSNLWAVKHGAQPGPVFVFAGHTDVVPPGPEDQWTSPPFSPTLEGDVLRARGAADMKGALAAMLVAVARFLEQSPEHRGTLAFLVTSDEEGPFVNGTTRVVDALMQRGQRIDFALVGEPSSDQTVGDRIRIGRRGSLTGHLTFKGVQGHVAYPQLADNAIHRAIEGLNRLIQTTWDDGNDHFPPTSLQVAIIKGGTVSNVIPGTCEATINFRFSSEYTSLTLRQKAEAILNQGDLEVTCQWTVNGEPFLTADGELVRAVSDAIVRRTGQAPILSTGGGTSDGRFLARTGAQVIELGLCSDSIHKVDEFTRVSDLELLTELYLDTLEALVR